MKNLAGVENADESILEELYLANINPIKVDRSSGEVPYSYIGKIGNWTFKRAWYYWMVSVDDNVEGLRLDIALELHNKKHPAKNHNLGEVIRSGGHCGAPSPDEYGAQPIYNDELYEKLKLLGYYSTMHPSLHVEYVPITVGEVSKLCNEGKLIIDRYVDSYHVDDQIGLNELVKVLKNELR